MSHDVIVCVHNGHTDVRNCLDSLIRNWGSGTLGRLIVVDDKSDSEMIWLLGDYARRHDFIDIIRLEEQHYYTKAANRGLNGSSAHIRTLLNSDTVVTPGWQIQIQEIFATIPSVGIVGPLSNAASTQSVPFVKSSKDQTAINSLPPEVSIDAFADFIRQSANGRITPFVPLVHGFCLTICSDVFEEIGYFDEEAFPRGYGEENDFCFRAEDAGFVLAIAIDTFIFHAKSKSYTSEDRTKFMHAGMKNFAAKHSVDRVKQAVQFMENNPHLQFMRNTVLQRWPNHYIS